MLNSSDYAKNYASTIGKSLADGDSGWNDDVRQSVRVAGVLSLQCTSPMYSFVHFLHSINNYWMRLSMIP